MATQTRTWQRKVLEQASRDAYRGLYWFVEMRLPGNIHASATHPGVFVPLIPVAPCPDTSGHWAHLLCELFRVGNAPTLQFEPALTSAEALQKTGVPWYEWGEQVMVDSICRLCGCVEPVDAELLAMSSAWICGECGERET